MRKITITDKQKLGFLGAKAPKSLFFFSLGLRVFLFFLLSKKKRNTLKMVIISSIDMKKKLPLQIRLLYI